MIARLVKQAQWFSIDSALQGSNRAIGTEEGTNMSFKVRRSESGLQLLLAILMLGSATISRAEPASEPRLSTTSQGQDSQRGSIREGQISNDEYAALLTSGDRKRPGRSKAQQKPAAASSSPGSQSPNTEFWFYDVDVELFYDFDHDGYYYGIDLWFDADTIYSAVDVYAVIYLSYEYGPWNEYAVTEDFTLFGTSGSDDYVIETELISGYMTGSYDILIELFDAYDGSFVADIGPDFSSELSLLPLEDAGRDAVGEPRIVVNSGGGGSPGWPLLLALTVVCLINTRHRMSTDA